MKMKYVTEDGSTFEDREDAEAHERLLGIKASVEEWASKELGTTHQASVTRAAKIVLMWEKDRDNVLAMHTSTRQAVAA